VQRRDSLESATLLALILMGASASWAQAKPPKLPAQDLNSSTAAYRIGAGDILQVIVFKEPDFSVPEVSVQPDGNVSLQFVGEIKAAGLTPLELQMSLAKALTPYIKDADVSILVKKIQSQKVSVTGAVKKGGSVLLTGPMTVLEALSEAGLDDFAKKNSIYVLRSEGGHEVKLPVRYKDVIEGKHPEQNILLKPGDTIVVP
jgi:polysaccharide export outer membrane protein